MELLYSLKVFYGSSLMRILSAGLSWWRSSDRHSSPSGASWIAVPVLVVQIHPTRWGTINITSSLNAARISRIFPQSTSIPARLARGESAKSHTNAHETTIKQGILSSLMPCTTWFCRFLSFPSSSMPNCRNQGANFWKLSPPVSLLSILVWFSLTNFIDCFKCLTGS